MFQFINNILEQFLSCFNRYTSWVNFCTIVIGFIMRPDVRGSRQVISVLVFASQSHSGWQTVLNSWNERYENDGIYE
jgi:hypothetical protein